MDVTVADVVVSQPPTTLLDGAIDAKLEANIAQLEVLKATFSTDTSEYLYYSQIIERAIASNLVASDYNPDDYDTTWGPETLPATSPASIEAGDYLMSSSITHYGYGLSKVTAVVAHLTAGYI